jgi:methylenetetrahydrofolate dehydrogenase (NADP+)/methenyltetrahydrofolate cyclohydrolase
MALILDGKKVRDEIFAELRPRIERLSRPPGLAVVLVGDDPASQIYVRNKVRACADLGIASFEIRPPATSTTEELIEIIDDLNARLEVDAILVQVPLPAQVNARAVLERIAPDKDADGFHPYNVGQLVANRPAPRACTPAGIIRMLKFYNVAIDGRVAVIVGRSDIVGKPMALMLLHENATVTMCHSRTINLVSECRRADILIAALGKPALVTAEFMAPGATVIDVGMNRVDDRQEAIRFGKAIEFERKGSVVVGDVEPAAVLRIASAYTPVPGGVGPLTIGMLMTNTVGLTESHLGGAGCQPAAAC